MQILESAAPTRPVARGNLDLCQRRLGVGHERAHVTATHVGAHHDAALAVFAADLVGAGCQFKARHLGQLDEVRPSFGTAGATRSARQRNRQALHAFHVVAQGLWQANQDVEAAVALEQCASLTPADGGGHGILDVGHVQPIARGFLAVDIHGQHGQAGGLLHLDLGRAGNLLQHGRDFFTCLIQDIHVVAKNLHRHIAANP